MIPDDQIRFVYEFLGDIEKEIVEEIRAGKVPENFDGLELKWLVLRKLREKVGFIPEALLPRWDEFQNEVTVRNL